MNSQITANRRTVLKTIGAGVVGSVAFASSASADNRDKGNDYGNGNGIGAFLNEKALWNKRPRDGGVVDKTGMAEVEVGVGTFTIINPPPDHEPTPGPFGFDPQTIEITTGTEVTWNWVDQGPQTPHHSVTNYNPDADDPSDPHTTGDHGNLFDFDGTGPLSESYTFNEPGTFLYFCHPHGTPYPAHDHFLGAVVENLLGMRGAVRVIDPE